MTTLLFRTGWMIILLGACISVQLRGQIQWHRAEIDVNPDADPFSVTPNGFYFAANGTRLARSTDAGATWSYVLTPPYSSDIISEIDVDADGDILLCSTNRTHHSTDNGESWTTSPEIPREMGDASTVVMTGSGAILAGTGEGLVIRLAPNGDKWVKVLEPGGGLARVASDSTGALFAMGFNSGLYHSTDDGMQWSRRGPEISIYITGLYAYSNGKLIAYGYGGNNGAYRTTDGGLSWNKIDTFGITMQRIIGHPAGPLFAISTYQGLFRSIDGGATWRSLAPAVPIEKYDLPYSVAPHIIVVPHTGDIICGGSGMGIIRSTDTGATWAPLDIRALGNFSVWQVARDPARGLLYATAERMFMWGAVGSGAVIRSSDEGEHWEMVHNVTGSQLTISGTGRIAMVRNKFILVSDDQGASWGYAGPYSEGGSIAYIGAAPDGMVVVEELGRYYYNGERKGVGPVSQFVVNARGVIVASGGGRSTDKGMTWLASTAPIGFSQIVTDAEGVLYAFSLTNTRAYKSTDDGATWTQLPRDYPIDYSTRIAMGPDGTLFLMTSAGAIYSYDDAAGTWEHRESPVPDGAGGRVLMILPGSKYLVGTASSGIYIGTTVTAVPEPLPEISKRKAAIRSSFPQPTSGISEIQFSLADAGHARISLFDVTGRPVATILNEHRPAGAQSVHFDAGELSSGIYICRLTTSGESAHATFVVTR